MKFVIPVKLAVTVRQGGAPFASVTTYDNPSILVNDDRLPDVYVPKFTVIDVGD